MTYLQPEPASFRLSAERISGKGLRCAFAPLRERSLHGRQPDAMAEIAKAFAHCAGGRVESKERIERLGDRMQRHLVGHRAVERVPAKSPPTYKL